MRNITLRLVTTPLPFLRSPILEQRGASKRLSQVLVARGIRRKTTYDDTAKLTSIEVIWDDEREHSAVLPNAEAANELGYQNRPLEETVRDAWQWSASTATYDPAHWPLGERSISFPGSPTST